MKYSKSLKLDEGGFASLVIAIVLIIVLGLLTVGFAELMRHSQMQELNRHLSDQAYYAAESGVNDAVRAIHNGFKEKKSDCGPITNDSSLFSKAGAKYLQNNVIDGDGTETQAPRWTCLLINPNPDSINYDSVDTVNPKVVVFKPVKSDGTATTLSDLEIYWQGTDASNKNFRSNSGTASGAFPKVGAWNSVGALRITLTPLGNLNRQNLIDNTYTAFLYPSDNASTSATFTNGSGNRYKQGAILNGGCNDGNTPKYCHVTINSITGNNGNGYLISLRSIYSPTSVVIKANNGDVYFNGAQTLIDATGKAQNVLKRIQVRVPNQPDYPYPGFVDDSAGGICKQLSVYPGSFPDMPCD